MHHIVEGAGSSEVSDNTTYICTASGNACTIGGVFHSAVLDMANNTADLTLSGHCAVIGTAGNNSLELRAVSVNTARNTADLLAGTDNGACIGAIGNQTLLDVTDNTAHIAGAGNTAGIVTVGDVCIFGSRNNAANTCLTADIGVGQGNILHFTLIQTANQTNMIGISIGEIQSGNGLVVAVEGTGILNAGVTDAGAVATDGRPYAEGTLGVQSAIHQYILVDSNVLHQDGICIGFAAVDQLGKPVQLTAVGNTVNTIHQSSGFIICIAVCDSAEAVHVIMLMNDFRLTIIIGSFCIGIIVDNLTHEYRCNIAFQRLLPDKLALISRAIQQVSNLAGGKLCFGLAGQTFLILSAVSTAGERTIDASAAASQVVAIQNVSIGGIIDIAHDAACIYTVFAGNSTNIIAVFNDALIVSLADNAACITSRAIDIAMVIAVEDGGGTVIHAHDTAGTVHLGGHNIALIPATLNIAVCAAACNTADLGYAAGIGCANKAAGIIGVNDLGPGLQVLCSGQVTNNTAGIHRVTPQMDGACVVALRDDSTAVSHTGYTAEILGVLFTGAAAGHNIAGIVAAFDRTACCITHNTCEILTGRNVGIDNAYILHFAFIQITNQANIVGVSIREIQSGNGLVVAVEGTGILNAGVTDAGAVAADGRPYAEGALSVQCAIHQDILVDDDVLHQDGIRVGFAAVDQLGKPVQLTAVGDLVNTICQNSRLISIADRAEAVGIGMILGGAFGCLTNFTGLGSCAGSLFPVMIRLFRSRIGIIGVDNRCIVGTGSITLVDNLAIKHRNLIHILTGERLSPNDSFVGLSAIQQVSNLAGGKLCFGLKCSAIIGIGLGICEIVVVFQQTIGLSVACHSANTAVAADLSGVMAVTDNRTALCKANHTTDILGAADRCSVVAVDDRICIGIARHAANTLTLLGTYLAKICTTGNLCTRIAVEAGNTADAGGSSFFIVLRLSGNTRNKTHVDTAGDIRAVIAADNAANFVYTLYGRCIDTAADGVAVHGSAHNTADILAATEIAVCHSQILNGESGISGSNESDKVGGLIVKVQTGNGAACSIEITNVGLADGTNGSPGTEIASIAVHAAIRFQHILIDIDIVQQNGICLSIAAVNQFCEPVQLAAVGDLVNTINHSRGFIICITVCTGAEAVLILMFVTEFRLTVIIGRFRIGMIMDNLAHICRCSVTFQSLLPDKVTLVSGAVQQVSNLAGSKLCFGLKGGAILGVSLGICQIVAIDNLVLILANHTAAVDHSTNIIRVLQGRIEIIQTQHTAGVVRGAVNSACIVAVINQGTGVIGTCHTANKTGSGNGAGIVALGNAAGITTLTVVVGTNHRAEHTADASLTGNAAAIVAADSNADISKVTHNAAHTSGRTGRTGSIHIAFIVAVLNVGMRCLTDNAANIGSLRTNNANIVAVTDGGIFDLADHAADISVGADNIAAVGAAVNQAGAVTGDTAQAKALGSQSCPIAAIIDGTGIAADQSAHIGLASNIGSSESQILYQSSRSSAAKQTNIFSIGIIEVQTGDDMFVAIEGSGISTVQAAHGHPDAEGTLGVQSAIHQDILIDSDVLHQDGICIGFAAVDQLGKPVQLTAVGNTVNTIHQSSGFIICIAVCDSAEAVHVIMLMNDFRLTIIIGSFCIGIIVDNLAHIYRCCVTFQSLLPDQITLVSGAVQQVSNLAGGKLCFGLKGGAVLGVGLGICQVVAIGNTIFGTASIVPANHAAIEGGTALGAGNIARVVAVRDTYAVGDHAGNAAKLILTGDSAGVIAILDGAFIAAANHTTGFGADTAGIGNSTGVIALADAACIVANHAANVGGTGDLTCVPAAGNCTIVVITHDAADRSSSGELGIQNTHVLYGTVGVHIAEQADIIAAACITGSHTVQSGNGMALAIKGAGIIHLVGRLIIVANGSPCPGRSGQSSLVDHDVIDQHGIDNSVVTTGIDQLSKPVKLSAVSDLVNSVHLNCFLVFVADCAEAIDILMATALAGNSLGVGVSSTIHGHGCGINHCGTGLAAAFSGLAGNRSIDSLRMRIVILAGERSRCRCTVPGKHSCSIVMGQRLAAFKAAGGILLTAFAAVVVGSSLAAGCRSFQVLLGGNRLNKGMLMGRSRYAGQSDLGGGSKDIGVVCNGILCHQAYIFCLNTIERCDLPILVIGPGSGSHGIEFTAVIADLDIVVQNRAIGATRLARQIPQTIDQILFAQHKLNPVILPAGAMPVGVPQSAFVLIQNQLRGTFGGTASCLTVTGRYCQSMKRNITGSIRRIHIAGSEDLYFGNAHIDPTHAATIGFQDRNFHLFSLLGFLENDTLQLGCTRILRVDSFVCTACIDLYLKRENVLICIRTLKIDIDLLDWSGFAKVDLSPLPCCLTLRSTPVGIGRAVAVNDIAANIIVILSIADGNRLAIRQILISCCMYMPWQV